MNTRLQNISDRIHEHSRYERSSTCLGIEDCDKEPTFNTSVSKPTVLFPENDDP